MNTTFSRMLWARPEYRFLRDLEALVMVAMMLFYDGPAMNETLSAGSAAHDFCADHLLFYSNMYCNAIYLIALDD